MSGTTNDGMKDEDDFLDAGFSGNLPEAQPDDAAASQPEPEPQPQPEPQPEAQPAAQPQASAAGGDQDFETRVLNLVDGRLRNHTGRVNQILEDRLKAFTPASTAAATAAAKEQGADTPNSKQINDALKDGEKFKKLAEDFPEWADALLEVQGAASAALEASLRKSIPQAEKVDLSGYVKNDALTTINERLVSVAHRNWKKDVNTPEFQAWKSMAPADIQALAESDDPEDAIALMDQYYAAREAAKSTSAAQTPPPPPPKPNQQNRLASAVQPSTGNTRPPAQQLSEDDGMDYGYKHA